MRYKSSRLKFFTGVFYFMFGICWTSVDILATAVDFEDVSLPAEGYYNGSDYAGGFTSRGVFFPNSYTDWGGGYTSWDNWACSNMTDTETPGYGNQYSAIAGSGNNSGNYAVAYPSYTTAVSTISLPYATSVDSAYFTNTTYAYYSMLNGDGFAKKFGGKSGTDADWFLLTITGKNASGKVVGTPVEFFLADFRDADLANHYIVNVWTSVALTSLLNNVKTLEFELTSSDVGEFGMNTPSYFAMDDLKTSVENTWNGSQNSVWSNVGNWSSVRVPGSGQNVLFSNNKNTAINLNGNRSIQNIAFDTAPVGSFTFNNNTLTLDADGSITVTSAVATSQSFNCGLNLAGNGFLVNDSTAAGQTLNVAGNIQSSAAGGVQNLVLGGEGHGLITGTIDDGITGGALGLIKQGNGIWTLTNNLDYTGDTNIQGGLLQLNGALSNLHAINGDGDLTVGDGQHPALLTADSIALNTVTVSAGSTIVIRPILGGPMSGGDDLRAVPEPDNFALMAIAALVLFIWRARQTAAA